MPQASIKSFFTSNKKPASANDGPDAKVRKVEPSGRESTSVTPAPRVSAGRGAASRLENYARGAREPAAALSSDAAERHRLFYNYFTGPRRRKNGDALAEGRRKMKPYDLQFIDLKKENAEAVLLIQNGYKYQILGADAYRVSKVLGRSPMPGWRTLEDEDDPTDGLYDRFASLTFPLERLPFYVEKLVMAGLKVAVAKQLETSALKAQGDNKRGPFRREVTDTYTKGTLVEELTASSIVTGHLLALTQQGRRIALVAVQPATGDVVFDSFDDASLATELETRLLHIQPSEVLVVDGPLEGLFARLVDSLDVRVVEVDTDRGESAAIPDIDQAISGDPGLLKCYLALRRYLNEFRLDNALTLEPHPFTLNSFMYLSGDTLQSLEIFENSTTQQVVGSLMWVLDMTKTPFGRRLLRSWVGKPLMDRALLAERVEAMEEIMRAEGAAAQLMGAVAKALPRMPDLERYALQVYHGRIAPKQLYWFLHFFNLIVTCVTDPQIRAAKLRSPLLQSVFAAFKPMERILAPLLQSINGAYVRHSRDSSTGNIKLASYFQTRAVLDADYCSSQDTNMSGSGEGSGGGSGGGGGDKSGDGRELSNLFVELESLEMRISSCRSAFAQYLQRESDTLGIALREVNALGEEDTFVIGVSKKEASKIPATWRRQGAVSTEVRYWAPFSIEQTKRLKPLLEQQAVTAKDAYDAFVARIARDSFDEMRRCVRSIATLDCLCSLAAVSSRPQYTKPDIVDEPCLEIEAGRHPMLEQLMLTKVTPNSVAMYATRNRVMLITGANMGGKSSYVRQVALLAIMAQVGCYVPAARARVSVMDGIYTRMGAFDNVLRGESTFMVELKECATIMAKATPRSLVIMDEIGRGTSTLDGVAIADAVLQYTIEDVRAFTLFITHYPLLCEKAQSYGDLVQNWSMDCAECEDEVTFLYAIVPHQASRSYGINVARLAGLPASILAAAQSKSAEFEGHMDARRAAAALLKQVQRALRAAAPAPSGEPRSEAGEAAAVVASTDVSTGAEAEADAETDAETDAAVSQLLKMCASNNEEVAETQA